MRTYNPKQPTDPRPEPLLRVLNLGAGTQSTAVALLHLDGTLPPLDAAVFADTGWEPQEVYDHLAKLRPVFVDAGVPLIEVSAGNIRKDALGVTEGRTRFASMPLFIDKENGDKAAMGRRQCTKEYKVEPIRRAILGLVAERLGITAATWRNVPAGTYVEQVFGISTDEVQRARTPRDRWGINYYPLLSLGWRREDTISYLEAEGWAAPRSACIGCPFHSDNEWRRLRDQRPDEWQDAVEFDQELRARATAASGFDGTPYLHRSMRPLDRVDLTTAEEHGQLGLFGDECEGMCGV